MANHRLNGLTLTEDLYARHLNGLKQMCILADMMRVFCEHFWKKLPNFAKLSYNMISFILVALTSKERGKMVAGEGSSVYTC